MVCHKKSFSSLLENNSFSSAVLSSRTIAEGVLQLVYSLEAGVHAVFCFREVEGVDTQPVDIVIDMFDAPAYSIKMSQALLSLWEMLYCIRFLSVIVKSWSGNFFRRGL